MYCQEMCKKKQQLREKAAIIMQNLSQDEGNVANKIIGTKRFLSAKCIFCYVSVGAEPRTDILINKALSMGKTVCVPLTKPKGIMYACKINSLSELKPAGYGLLEPQENALVIDPSLIDLAIVPCVAASQNGERLGHGRGYYDRFLPQTNAYKIVLCREELVFPDIPTTELDIICDELVF